MGIFLQYPLMTNYYRSMTFLKLFHNVVPSIFSSSASLTLLKTSQCVPLDMVKGLSVSSSKRSTGIKDNVLLNFVDAAIAPLTEI